MKLRLALLAGCIALVFSIENAATESVSEISGKAAGSVCHKPGTSDEKTLSVSEPAIGPHLGHGDLLGACGDADIIFYNGQVVTIEPLLPQTEALAIRGEDILAIGPDAGIFALHNAQTQAIDLEGRALLPGFVDAHNHIYNSIFNGQNADQVGTTYGEAQQRLLEVGTTTIANANIWPGAIDSFLEFAVPGALRVRTSLYLGYNSFCGPPWPDDWYLAYPKITDPHAMLRIPGIKIFADGAACNNAALSFLADGGDLYFTEPGEPDLQAQVIQAATALAAIVVDLQELGYQAAIHALGDRAVTATLNALEMALDGEPNVHRHRMEHNRYVNPVDLPRYGEIGAIPIMFGEPRTCFIVDNPGSILNDPAFFYRLWRDNWRAMLDANPGHHIVWKSDFPYFSLEPLRHLWTLVTRDELRVDGSVCEAPDWLADSAITVEEALATMTIEGAYALAMEEKIGSLTPGKFADVLVLSDNPMAVVPDALVDLEVLVTIVGGSAAYCGNATDALCPDS